MKSKNYVDEYYTYNRPQGWHSRDCKLQKSCGTIMEFTVSV